MKTKNKIEKFIKKILFLMLIATVTFLAGVFIMLKVFDYSEIDELQYVEVAKRVQHKCPRQGKLLNKLITDDGKLNQKEYQTFIGACKLTDLFNMPLQPLKPKKKPPKFIEI